MTTEQNHKLSVLAETNFFQSLSGEEMGKLVDVFVIETYPSDHMLVRQNDEASDFYIILSGKAEVWLQKETKKPLLVATLGKSDIIGHIDIDIDAKEPIKRNASVVTVSPTSVMKASVSDIEPFLHRHSEIQQKLRDYRHRIDIINFIKSSTPFIDISYQTAVELVDKLIVKEVEEGADIIKQGDEAEECYFIEKGAVSVIIKDEAGKEKKVKELTCGDLFGELGLFEGNRRNATIRAESPCRLYALSRDHFLSVLKRHGSVARKVSYLSKHRNRPKKNKGIVIIEQTDHAGNSVYILKNPNTHRYLRVQHEGWYLWQQMDGIKTIHELIIGYLEEFGKFMPQQIMKLILDLDEMGMVNMTYYKPSADKLSLGNRLLQWVSKIFEIKYTFRNVDKTFSRIYNSFGHYIYHKGVIVCLSLLIVTGFIAFWVNTPHAHHLFKSLENNYLFLFYIYLTLPFAITLHEFAHGLTTKAIGCEVGGFGVGWYWFGPIAFCDTTDAWLAPAKDRIKVNIAGLFSDLCFAGITSILALVLVDTYWGLFFWLFSATFYVISIVNMGTLIELDGYYVLADLLDEPNLRRKAFLWIDKLPKQIFHLTLLRQNYKCVIYWLVTLSYIAIVVMVYSYFQANILFYMLPEKVIEARHYLQLILPSALVILMFLTVRADIKSYR